ncbi:ribonuclease P protein component [Candidatus Uhrbacteria bacterium]|nr:ribonuclease P protein component [Candidatus Uhrbacteria bacterium]
MLPRRHRLHQTRDVQRVSRTGRPVAALDCIIRFAPNRLPLVRATVVAGLKVSKRSTVRNRTKRLIREVLRRHLPSIRPGVDLVITAKPSMVGKEYEDISAQIGAALHRAHLLCGFWVDIHTTHRQKSGISSPVRQNSAETSLGENSG